MEIRLRGTKEELHLALKKLEQVFEIVKYPTKDYPTRKDPQLIHWYVTVKVRGEDENDKTTSS